jgi:hypothetical protein
MNDGLGPISKLLNGSVPAEGARRLVNFKIRVLLTVLVESVPPMYLTTLGNDRSPLRVANESLTPDVHDTSKPSNVEVSPSIRRRRTEHLSISSPEFWSVAVNRKPDVVKLVSVTSPPYSVSATRRRRYPIALALAAVTFACHEMHDQTGYSFVCVLCRY